MVVAGVLRTPGSSGV